MYQRISTYLSQRSVIATVLSAALIMWYVASATVIPAALQLSRMPVAIEPAAEQAEAGAMCVGMACSIEAKDGAACCCAPDASDEESKPVSVQLTKDCDDLGALTLSVARSMWQIPVRGANLILVPEFTTAFVAADDMNLLSSHPEDIEHIPILLFV